MDLRQQFGITEEKRVRTVTSTMDQEWLIVNSNNLLSPQITTIIWGFHRQKANVIYELAFLINSENSVLWPAGVYDAYMFPYARKSSYIFEV